VHGTKTAIGAVCDAQTAADICAKWSSLWSYSALVGLETRRNQISRRVVARGES
jgi:hypothetical protein